MRHKGTVTLHTDRLTLRPFAMTDAGAMFTNWASDPEVTKFLTWPPHKTEGVTRQILAAWCTRYIDNSFYQWAIVPDEIGEPVGSISAVKIDERTRSATIGYCIGSRWWGQGITAEALRAVIEFFFDRVGMSVVNACHDPRNPNSGRVMRKCGMVYEGTWRQGGVNNQGVCDEVWYSILRDEYVPVNGDWDMLYKSAKAVQNGRMVSEYVEAGGVAAAIMTNSGKIYTGVCVDTSCTLGICAERNAIFNMLTQGETEIRKVLAIMPDGRTGAPCGACRELMVQLMPESYRDIEIMLDWDTRRTVRLGDITPEWWI